MISGMSIYKIETVFYFTHIEALFSNNHIHAGT